ncbi:MAG: RNA-binding protein [Sulfurimonas sp. RIFCSPHIGHO2_12_FULL_36_9]|uniref:KH domain-containing protein n=1 Tax=Sulfurimonas sp. RIFCSPLOWO2_12_36_12 TaxID=1802253 RepID=UPI0008C5FD26|nr:KH domain-containing protein [Sulfurimonas sp. RIFCSPLOWO2_12_36_12]OHD97855.1 MAG: RNA-binding protein [Sulfurimonas sp. RIFCSPLOWO2_02_FULL_36_28]OHD98347.1 MAG: RNA-binding protein [Sulfurimonas sp. RIFCSPHIGHO2_12_FULL_36_9]OHE00961.1 MAG: RNA-binding protein [Sulfurimonas sp. RIFCSPLOWO2_12_36_12]OHE01411.1 MAG: RNA-binding protein [Sulfurimonas sp. RIFCSPLOWO2_12_FULL_36_74]
MIADFVAQFARLIASNPDDVRVEVKEGDEITEILLYANQADIGKLIGKEGKMIGAIKTVISGCKAKDGVSYRINVEAIK